LLLDISKAFDRTWREALFHKLLDMGHDRRAVAELAALYRTLRTRVKVDGTLSEWIEAALGLGQGSPNSTHLFGAFLADLPDLLRSKNLGLRAFGLFIACLIFLDDLAVPLTSPAQVVHAFQTLHKYADRWGLSFNVSKCAVLCYNFPYPPQAWPFGQGVVRTSTVEKYLTNKLSTDGSPAAHINTRLRKANGKLGMLRKAGLLGGANAASASSTLVKAHLWPIIDSGRSLADLHLACNLSLRKRLDTFQLKVGRTILGLSPAAPSDGVLGELGWMPDNTRGDLRSLLFLGRILCQPDCALSRTFMVSCLETLGATPDLMPPFLQHCLQLTVVHDLDWKLITQPGWKARVTSLMRSVAQRQWHRRLLHQPELQLVYPPSTPFKMQPYLTLEPFPGRHLLTQLRVNDYMLATHPLSRVESQHCASCDTGSRETRAHFLLHCPAFAGVRRHHLPHCAALGKIDQWGDNQVLRALLMVSISRAAREQTHATAAYLLDLVAARRRITGYYAKWSSTTLPYH
jgi:hypothetical protein